MNKYKKKINTKKYYFISCITGLSIKIHNIIIVFLEIRRHCWRNITLKFPSWFWAQTCLNHDQWFLRIDGNEVVWSLGITVKHLLVLIGILFLVECLCTVTFQKPETMSEPLWFLFHSVNKQEKVSFILKLIWLKSDPFYKVLDQNNYSMLL